MSPQATAEHKQIKAIFYCRVSSMKQACEGANLDSQDRLHRVCAEAEDAPEREES